MGSQVRSGKNLDTDIMEAAAHHAGKKSEDDSSSCCVSIPHRFKEFRRATESLDDRSVAVRSLIGVSMTIPSE